jgi:glutathione S-transferase
MPAERTLVVLSYSPWSERARWVLDHHGLPYRTVYHSPFLGERRLRRLVGPGVARATVPVLRADGELFTNSWDIARYADRVGRSSKLVPSELEESIAEVNERAERAMERGRALVVAGLLASPQALDESLPPGIPKVLRPVLRPVTRYGTEWFGRKYGLSLRELQSARQALRNALASFRQQLGTRSYLLGRFSYADVVLCSMLQGVVPVDDRYVPLGPGQRKVWTQSELAEEFADLIGWRDRLYREARHLPGSFSPAAATT